MKRYLWLWLLLLTAGLTFAQGGYRARRDFGNRTTRYTRSLLYPANDANEFRPLIELPCINVKDSPYLAKGDGVNDDTAELQAALTAGSADQVVYIPPGTYLVTSSLTVPSDITVIGAGSSSVIKTTTTGVDLLDCSGVSNVTIQDLKLYGPSSGAGRGLDIENACSNVAVRNCSIQGSYNGIYIRGASTRCIVHGCYVTQTLSGGIRVDASDLCCITSNQVFSNNTDGIHIDNDTTDSIVTGNSVYLNGNEGIRIETCYNNSIVGNVVRGNGADGIYLYNLPKYNIVSGNTILDNCIPTGATTAYGVSCTNGIAGISTSAGADWNVINSNVMRSSSSSVTTLDDAESNWTAKANVTCVLNSSSEREGTYAVQVTIADAFTTGQCCYMDITDRDLSAVTTVSLWLWAQNPLYNTLQLAFYSDDAATTELGAFDVLLSTQRWQMVNVYLGDTSGWATVKAMGFKVTADPGASNPFFMVDTSVYPARQHFGMILEQWGKDSIFSECNYVYGNSSLGHERGEVVNHLGRGCAVNGYILSGLLSDISTSGTGEDNLGSTVLPQNSHEQFRGLRVRAAGTKTNSNGNKTIKLYWGASSVTFHEEANNTNDWRLEAELIFVAADDANLSWVGYDGTTMLQGYEDGFSDDLSAGDITLKITGECANGSDVISQTMFQVEAF